MQILQVLFRAAAGTFLLWLIMVAIGAVAVMSFFGIFAWQVSR